MTAQDAASRLPDPTQLERVSLALAALDLVLLSDPYDRMFSYEPNWRGDTNLASMNNGAGGEYRIIFDTFGTLVMAFDHESPLSPWNTPNKELVEGLVDGIPKELTPLVTDPAFAAQESPAAEVTFCAWAKTDAVDGWITGPLEDDGGAAWLLEVVMGDAASLYTSFLNEVREPALMPEQLAPFFALEPISHALLEELGSELATKEVLAGLATLGYPGTL